MKLTTKAKDSICEAIIQHTEDACRRDPEYLRNIILDCLDLDEWDDEQLLSEYYVITGKEHPDEQG